MKFEPIPALRTRKNWPAVLPFVALVIAVTLVAMQPPSDDVAWQLWVGRSLSHGARLYRDIIEINPPLWFWLAVPVVDVSSWLQVSAPVVLVALLGIAAAASIAFAYCLVDERRAELGLSMVLVFFFAGLSATGQREQFTLITVVPYVLLAARRAEGKPVSTRLAILIGMWAALGICLKPFFVVVPLFLEAWTFVRLRRPTPEFLTVTVLGGAYLGATVLVYPAYFTVVQPLVRANYGALNKPLSSLLTSDTVMIAALGLLTFIVAKERSERMKAFAIAGAAFLVAFLVQSKGWRYHGLPAIGCFALLAVESLRVRRAAVLGALTLLLVLSSTNAERSVPYAATMAATRDMKPGSSVAIVSGFANPAWPTVELRGLQWRSPYMFLWMRNDRAYLVRAAAQDILRRPERVLVDRRLDLLSEPQVRSALTSYERGPTYRYFDTFKLTAASSHKDARPEGSLESPTSMRDSPRPSAGRTS